jgi:anti-sigma factor RsiW
MCPDRDLVSAYTDGEVPSPWRERLEEHMASCRDCAALAASYAKLSESLRVEEEPGEAAALARGRERLDALLAEMPVSLPQAVPRFSGLRAVFGRSVSLPLPFAAAVALLVLILGGATTVLAFKPERGDSMQQVASGEIDSHLAKPASMEELLHYLNSSDGQVQLTINLPSGATFGSTGKPVIMRSNGAMPGKVLGEGSP